MPLPESRNEMIARFQLALKVKRETQLEARFSTRSTSQFPSTAAEAIEKARRDLKQGKSRI